MVALGSVLIGAAFASLSVATAVAALVAMVFVWTLGEIVAAPPASAFVADRSPEHARGRYQASLGMMFALGGVIGPVIGTVVYARSPNALWIGCGVAGLFSAGLALAAGKYPAPALPARLGDRVDAPGT
jgi:MFS family permease